MCNECAVGWCGASEESSGYMYICAHVHTANDIKFGVWRPHLRPKTGVKRPHLYDADARGVSNKCVHGAYNIVRTRWSGRLCGRPRRWLRRCWLESVNRDNYVKSNEHEYCRMENQSELNAFWFVERIEILGSKPYSLLYYLWLICWRLNITISNCS